MSLWQDASGFAESTAPLAAEGEIANPLSSLPVALKVMGKGRKLTQFFTHTH
jgi:hypothetical protein